MSFRPQRSGVEKSPEKISKKLLVSKIFVSLQSEINRGTVQFRRPQFGDDLFGESQPVGFFVRKTSMVPSTNFWQTAEITRGV